MATATSSLGRPEVFNNSTGAAFMTFHRTGSYASYFGLDTDNVWKVGGWSAGAVAYKIWHAGNHGAGSGLDADLLDGQNLVAGAATASSVAGRDSSGDIYARLIRETFADQATISGGMVFRVNNSTDNYLRVCNSPSAILSYLGAQASLGFTPVQQGGGTGQFSNKLYMGWNNAGALLLQVDSTNFSSTWPINVSGSAASLANNNYQINSLGVGTAASGTAGEIRATNNITAYFSDDRLKVRHSNIPDALAKVLSLNGFYFTPNQVAQDLGYSNEMEIGVSAQEVEIVLPEIVVPAPIDEQYKTVRYEKLIPLLIEAIKEQQLQIEQLKMLGK